MATAQGPMTTPAHPMPLGILVQAPDGFLSFCITHAADCAAEDDRQGEQAARFARLELARRWTERVPLVATASLPGSITPEAFTAASLEPSDEALPAPEGDLALLASINTSINHRIRPMSDIQHYGVEDYWATPIEDSSGQAYGDCEDYALEKRRALIAAGVAPRDLTMALALTRRGELHVVLMLSTSSGEYVADSLTDRILPWQDVPYTWIARQERGRPMVWRAAAVKSQSPGPHRS